MRLKFAIFLLASLSILTNCTNSLDQTVNDHEIGDNSTMVDESYAVYSAFLKTIRTGYGNGKKVDLFVILRDTEKYPSTIDRTSLDLSEEFPEQVGEAINDFNSKISTSRRLTKSFDLEKNYVLVNDDDLNFERDGDDSYDFWKTFYEKFPNSSGIIRLSQVGFDSKKTNAFLYLDLRCGGTCAEQDFLLLTKMNGEWKLTKTITLGVS
ncbi:MAG: hypothetical protein R2681_07195 [Pyrinomonadaceae bacterium]